MAQPNIVQIIEWDGAGRLMALDAQSNLWCGVPVPRDWANPVHGEVTSTGRVMRWFLVTQVFVTS